MEWISKLIGEEKIQKVLKNRRSPMIREKIPHALLDVYEAEGWEVQKRLKTTYWVSKNKKFDEQFEDTVWCLLANMGFKTMSKDRSLKIPYGPRNEQLTKQVDVLAIDDETIIVVECKATDSEKKGNFKTIIEAMKGYEAGLIKELHKEIQSNPKKRIKFIFATKNYKITTPDKNRMEEFDIFHLCDSDIHYFTELTNHLGTAARFQFLGALFRGQKITAMKNKIPAIRGKMGGHTYYSFVIEPLKLLKISYVSHRIDSKGNSAPAYQRLVNKSRLQKIKKFIDGGGFFPNSLIVSLDTGGKNLHFEPANIKTKGDSNLTRVGMLHLPQKYSSAYIIDGQHRLYGYSDSQYDDTNAVPVVAFINLDKEKQVELFMEINENQKKVPKHLQNTLNADLLWDDPSENHRRKAIRLQVAIELGSNPKSALYQRIILEERTNDPYCNITIETIEDALKQSDFLSKFDAQDGIRQHGFFDHNDSEKSKTLMYDFFELIFGYFRTSLEQEWIEDPKQQVLVSNNSIFGIIKLTNDIVEHLVKKIPFSVPIYNIEKLFEEMIFYLDPVAQYFETISDFDRSQIKGFYGAGGKIFAWRKLQQFTSKIRNDFSPLGLQEWQDDHTMEYNTNAYRMLFKIETHLKDTFRSRLESHYGENYFSDGVPRDVVMEARNLATEKDLNDGLMLNTTDLWDCLNLIHYRDIALHGSNWSNLFKDDFSYPVEGKEQRSKKDNTSWLEKVNRIRNKTHHNNPISKDEFSYLKEIYDWLIES